MIKPAFEILNQRGTPMFFSDIFANRPNAGIVGRIFISTDTFAFYRDNGVTWDLIGGPGTGTITGSGTPFKYAVFTNTGEIGDGSIEQFTNENKSTKDFFIETSTSGGFNETTLKLTNVFAGSPDSFTFKYGRTILAGSPFLEMRSNSVTYPTTRTLFTESFVDFKDQYIAVDNTITNQVGYFAAVEPELTIAATGVSNRAILTLSPSTGNYAGTIRTGSANNDLEFQTGIPSLTRYKIYANGNSEFNTNGQSVKFSTFYPTGTDGRNIYIGNGGLLGSGTTADSSYNVAVGVDALLNQTTGAYNVALGWEAGKGLTTGGENILIGWQSGLVITSGFQNIYIGGGAGDAGTTATRNTIIGSNAFSGNTSGQFNCALGRNSLRFGTSGSENTAIGNDTLQNVTGNRNTALGYQAATIPITNTNSIFLGAQSNPQATSGTNEIVIGYAVGGNGSNTSVIGNSSTLSTRLYGDLLLGSNTPSVGAERLQVTGTAKFTGNVTSSTNFISNNGIVDNRLSWSSTPAGVVGTISNHALEFYTNGGVKMLLSASGNLGLNVTPSAWVSTEKAIQLSNTASIVGTTTNTMKLGNNFYFDGNNKYIASLGATLYQQISSEHRWYNAPSGTAGTNITFTQAMTLDASGNLLIGSATSSGERLQVTGTAKITGNVEIGGNLTLLDADNLIVGTTTGTKIGTSTSQKLAFWNATPIVQPTTAIAGATLVAPGGGTNLKDVDTFDGYTINQVVKALRDIGILA